MVLNGTHKMQINVKHIAKQSNFPAFLCKQSFRFLYHYAAALLENCDGKLCKYVITSHTYTTCRMP